MSGSAETLDGRAIGPYRLAACVARAEFGAVWRAEHTVLGTQVAVKLLHAEQEAHIARALAAVAQLQARVRHPNVVRVLDGGTFEDRPYLVMDWVEGTRLADWLAQGGAPEVDVALAVFRALVRGLHAVHEAGVVHRDLKPANVLLAAGEVVPSPRLIGFGLAKGLEAGEVAVPHGLSVEFRTLGTPEYMAPEQSGQAGYVDARADLFSAGVVLYELLTGRRPFEADEAWRVMGMARMGRFTPIRQLRPELPEAIDPLIADLLAGDPGGRLGSAGELLCRLDAIPGSLD